MPFQSSAAILRRNGSTCSRKSVRFADDDVDYGEPKMTVISDPKKQVRFATDRNLSYMYPCVASQGESNDVISSNGNYASCSRDVDLGKICYVNSDNSGGLYVLNRPNGYQIGETHSLIGFTTFLPTDGSLV